MRQIPVIIPARTAHSHTVIFLHDRGDDAESLSASLHHCRDSRGRTLYDMFPTFRWVFPKSGVTVSFSAAGNKVSQWFDIWNPQDFSDREEIQTLGLKESAKQMRQILAIEAGILGGRWDRIVLAGIGQGTATAAHVLLNAGQPPRPAPDADKDNGSSQSPKSGLGAFVGFSGRMPFPGRDLAETRAVLKLEAAPETDEVIRRTPVLLEHCADDQVIPVQHGRLLRDTLQGFGAQVAWREYAVGGHWVHSPTGVDEAAVYLEHVLKLHRHCPDARTTTLGTDRDVMDLS